MLAGNTFLLCRIFLFLPSCCAYRVCKTEPWEQGDTLCCCTESLLQLNTITLNQFYHFLCFPGSEGKLTIVTQRMGMLTGIGNLSYNSVMGHTSVHALASSMVEMFIVPLQQEGQSSFLHPFQTGAAESR